MIRRVPTVAIIGSGKLALLKALAQMAGQCVAEAGCNLVSRVGSSAELAAKAFHQTPYRVGSSLGVLSTEIAESTRSPRKQSRQQRSVVEERPWVDFQLTAPNSDDDLVTSSSDIVIAMPGNDTTEAQVLLALDLGKPVIALLAKDQKIGRYGYKSLPRGVALAHSRDSLVECLAKLLSPLAIARPTFANLKSKYKTDAGSVHSCSMTFPNTCAIRMSEALDKAVPGIIDKFKASAFNKCPHNFIRGAQDLASVLRQADVFGVYNQGFEAPGSAPDSVKEKKGIICYMNIPAYPDAQGHIDLWDGAGPVGSAYWTGNPIWFWHLS